MADEFHRTVFEVELVSAGPPPTDMTIHEVADYIDSGTMKGAITRIDSWPITRQHARAIILMQGGDPTVWIPSEPAEKLVGAVGDIEDNDGGRVGLYEVAIDELDPKTGGRRILAYVTDEQVVPLLDRLNGD